MGMTDWNTIYDREKNRYIHKPAFFNTDIKAVRIARGRLNVKCCDCGKQIVSGEITIGGDANARRCLKCVAPFFEAIRVELKSFDKLMRETEKKMKKNKAKYENINLLANLK